MCPRYRSILTRIHIGKCNINIICIHTLLLIYYVLLYILVGIRTIITLLLSYYYCSTYSISIITSMCSISMIFTTFSSITGTCYISTIVLVLVVLVFVWCLYFVYFVYFVYVLNSYVYTLYRSSNIVHIVQLQ